MVNLLVLLLIHLNRTKERNCPARDEDLPSKLVEKIRRFRSKVKKNGYPPYFLFIGVKMLTDVVSCKIILIYSLFILL